MSGIYNGFISKHINRKLSEPLARMLAGTKLTANQATWGALAIALLSFVSFVMGQSILGGLLAQLSSIADGIDGSLARLKGTTSAFGGFLDSVLDRYADAVIVLGMILWSRAYESYPGTWLVGFLAIVGTITVSYSRASIDPDHRLLFDRGFLSMASRDVRLFLVMLGGITGQVYLCLLALAILTNAVVFYRLIYSYSYLRARDKNPRPDLPTPEPETEDALSDSHQA